MPPSVSAAVRLPLRRQWWDLPNGNTLSYNGRHLIFINIGKIAGVAGYAFTIVSMADAAYQFDPGQVSAERFSYKFTGGATVMVVGAASGGGAVVLGAGLFAAELAYDHVVDPYVHQPAVEKMVETESWLRNRAMSRFRMSRQ